MKQKERPFSALYFLFGAFLLWFFLFVHLSSPGVSFPDFQVYIQSYQDFHAHKNIYGRFLSTFPEKDPTGKHFAYLPPFVCIGFILSRMSFPLNFFVFQTLSLLCFYASFFLLFRHFTGVKNSGVPFFAASLLLWGFPMTYTFALGQVNAFLLFCVTVFLVALKKQKPYLAACALLPAALLKFFPALLYAVFIKTKKNALVFSLGLMAGFFLLSFLLFPDATNIFFARLIPARFFLVENAANQSLAVFLKKAGIPYSVVLLFLMMMLLFAVVKFAFEIPLAFFLLAFSFLLIPLSWVHHYVLLYPAALYLIGKNGKTSAFGIVSLILISLPPVKNFFLLTYLPLYGLLLLTGALFREQFAAETT